MENAGRPNEHLSENISDEADAVHHFESVNVEELTSAQAEEILSKTEVHGTPFSGASLTVANLRQAGLAPSIRIRFSENVDMSISPVYQLDHNGYVAVIAYVREGQRTVARSFYMSQSQLVWRYLPQYLAFDGEVQWFGKWVSEFAITGPSELQEVLTGMNDKGVMHVDNPMRIFTGTARSVVDQHATILDMVQSLPEYLPQKEIGYHRSKGMGEYCKPQEVGTLIPPEKQPLFTRGPIAQWKTKNALYGNVDCEIFTSLDESLRYQFCRDSLGRGWIANIENTSAVTGVGVRKVWVDGGDLVTTAFEYSTQSRAYGNPKISKRKYVDMYTNYLSKVPLIRSYMKSAITRELDPVAQAKIIRGLVNSSDSIAQLYSVLRSIPEDKPGKAEWETTIECIGLVSIGEAKTANITNRYGIRRRAYELISEEKIRRNSQEKN